MASLLTYVVLIKVPDANKFCPLGVDKGGYLTHVLQWENCVQHHSNVIWASWRLNSPAIPLSAEQPVQVNNKWDIRAPDCWPFVRGIHRLPVDSPHKGPAMRKMFPWHKGVTHESGKMKQVLPVVSSSEFSHDLISCWSVPSILQTPCFDRGN